MKQKNYYTKLNNVTPAFGSGIVKQQRFVQERLQNNVITSMPILPISSAYCTTLVGVRV